MCKWLAYKKNRTKYVRVTCFAIGVAILLSQNDLKSGGAIMPNIKPISDLRNYTSVVKEVNYGSRVYLTKNGHGQIAMINMQELDDLEKQLALYRFQIEMQKGEQSIATEGTISSKELRKELGI